MAKHPIARFPRQIQSDERGIALAIAIFALVIIATMISGIFFMGRLEQRSGSNTVWSTQASEAAEAGLNVTIGNWPTALNSMALGTDTILPTATVGASARYTVTVRKLTNEVFFLSSRGERIDAAGNNLVGTSLGRLVRIVIPDIEAEAALTSKGPVTVGGNAEVDGHNINPPGWTCGTPGPDVAGVRTDQTVTIKGKAIVDGDPPTDENDSGVVDDIFLEPFNALLPLATHTLSGSAFDNMTGMTPTVSGGLCDRGNTSNWGEPWRNPPLVGTVTECIDYFPILYRPGNMQVQTGRGQGILLVDGDLEIRGNFEYNGIVIVLGEIKGNGTGNKITGAAFANNAEIGDLTSIIGDPQIRYSSCAIAEVLGDAAKVLPTSERSWVQLY